jgi:hypothetical protein
MSLPDAWSEQGRRDEEDREPGAVDHWSIMGGVCIRRPIG